jgi:3-methyladenine DNA glycosylase/8-oxoguanine DNA glycosylase
MERIGSFGLQVRPLDSLFEGLAESIVYQQLTTKAAATIHARIRALGRTGFPTPEELEIIDDATLRGAGLSMAKVRALRDLAAKQVQGLLPTVATCATLGDDVLIERLTVVRGIGPWSVEMLLMFRLGRQDVLPTTDYGIQKGFQRVFRTRTLPTPQQVATRGERWRPFRSMAAWYLWRALDAVPSRPTGARRAPRRSPNDAAE